MTFTRSIRSCLGKYASFSGRASRSEYWWFFLFVFLTGAVAGVLDVQLFGSVTTSHSDSGASAEVSSPTPIGSIVSLLLFLPHLAAAWRRMHDSGRSGLYALFPFLMITGAGLVLIFGIGIADIFSSGGSLDILFTRLTVLILVPTLIVLVVSPLLVLFWLTRPSDPQDNRFGPVPPEVRG